RLRPLALRLVVAARAVPGLRRVDGGVPGRQSRRGRLLQPGALLRRARRPAARLCAERDALVRVRRAAVGVSHRGRLPGHPPRPNRQDALTTATRTELWRGEPPRTGRALPKSRYTWGRSRGRRAARLP